MPFNTSNLIVSLALLQSRGVAKDKLFAASITSALIPGAIGLALPLIIASNGKATAKTPVLSKVPRLAGLTQEEAADALKSTGLSVGKITQAFVTSDAEDTTGQVVAQSPLADTFVAAGTAVDLTISLGADAGDIPKQLLTREGEIIQKLADQGEKLDRLIAKD